MNSIICLFELVYLNAHLFDKWLDHVVKEVNIKAALKSSILVVQKAAAPKNDDTVAVRPQAWCIMHDALMIRDN